MSEFAFPDKVGVGVIRDYFFQMHFESVLIREIRGKIFLCIISRFAYSTASFFSVA
jgi:hypothetical protein